MKSDRYDGGASELDRAFNGGELTECGIIVDPMRQKRRLETPPPSPALSSLHNGATARKNVLPSSRP